jgi:hypothetical protein
MSRIDFIEAGGPRTLPGCIHPLGNGLHTMSAQRKGEATIKAVFCYGPFPPFLVDDLEEGEITLLTGSHTGREAVRAAIIVAGENLAILRGDIRRRKRERIG